MLEFGFSSPPSLQSTFPALADAIFERVARAVLDRLHVPAVDTWLDTDALELALAYAYKTGDPEARRSARDTLVRFASGPARDPRGGFVRTHDGHAVKRLDDHADLLRVYLHACQLLPAEELCDTARSIIDYTRRNWHADREDYFYAGDQEGGVDRSLITDANARMTIAFYEASRALNDPALYQIAASSLGEVGAMFEPGKGMYHTRADPHAVREGLGHLASQAESAQVCLEGFQATARPTYLTRARMIVDLALAQSLDRATWRFVSPTGFANARQAIDDHARLAGVMTRLFQLTGEEKYRDTAARTLGAFAASYDALGAAAARYALAVDQWLHFPLHITIVGAHADSAAQALLDTALNAYAPARAIELVDPVRDTARLARLGYTAASRPQAFICADTLCLPPVSSSGQIAQALARLSKTGEQ